MAVNIKEAMVSAEDPAGKQIVGVIHKTVKLALFTRTINAQWAADEIIKQEAYPFSEIFIETNRDLFRYEVGNLFALPYARYGIDGMICRVLNIQEEDLESEKIIVTAAEDPNYFGESVPVADITIPVGDGEAPTTFLVTPLSDFIFIEAPYILAGDQFGVLPLVGREEGFEVGYHVYMSIDGGNSYTQIENVTAFAIHGTLVDGYTLDTYTIDDEVGFQIDVEMGASQLQTITRDQLFTTTNLTVLGSGDAFEIITWQTITPVSGYTDRYEITGVYRGRYGTSKMGHPIETDFFFVSDSRTELILHNEFVIDFTPYFKVVPYSSTSISSIEYAIGVSLTLDGYAMQPYEPLNFKSNDETVNPTYFAGEDLVLEWTARVRGDGLGLENPDYVAGGEPVWEGYFEIRVYVDDVLVRTETDIDAVTFTYTDAMNVTDNGSAADSIQFRLKNFRTVGVVPYSSDWIYLTVTKTV